MGGIELNGRTFVWHAGRHGFILQEAHTHSTRTKKKKEDEKRKEGEKEEEGKE